ncbi:hypothetical protein Kisp01_50740 [Kineosporia sp. NBRC 101677]|uniref:hypothetical protein n=1 Tax=Kineosporia sp. NBRC 101677 TaxID=3032197 RepID=UPI0024A10347|nr:hypothetical protein [Kineosporia sp. NBRC 101677]GLY18060.1 hypothetical protein Kisp01_50740 [Kineosporia sp. NBRC 101677]
MPHIRMDARPAWVPADLTADPVQWARATVRERAGAEQADLSDERAGLLAEVLVPALRAAAAEEAPPVMLLFLIPEATEPSVCSVSIRVEPVPPSATPQSLLEDVRLPEPMLERPAEEETVPTAAGPATHLVQRYRVPVSPEYEMVQEHELFLWRIATEEGVLAIYLSTSYLDLTAAGQWRPELVALASGLDVVVDDPVLEA